MMLRSIAIARMPWTMGKMPAFLMSIAWAGRAVCVAFHPGWVRTDMGGAGADLTPEQSVADMRRTIAGLSAADNGRFLNHDGTPIDW